jgi:DNA invertase Pin-like site-specific DNA recombinase
VTRSFPDGRFEGRRRGGPDQTPGRGPDKPIRCALYCRISLARFGDTLKVDEQERVCRDLAAARNWTVDDAHVFKDNSISAWRRGRKRPGWDAMLEAITNREVDAIVVYHGDRLIRQPTDLEFLIEVAEKRGILLASPRGERDLGNHDDQFILRIEVAAAHREVASTSRRLKQMFARRAEEGYVRLGGRGGRVFGYEPDGLTVREAEADMVREVAERILQGESVGAICRDLNARGYRTTPGNEWKHGSLAKLMRRPRFAGLVEHNGQIVGQAAWPAILDRDTWEAVVARLSGKAEQLGFTPNNMGRYLLSGIAVCGPCGNPLAVRWKMRFVHPCPSCGVPLRVRTNPGTVGVCAGCEHVVPLPPKVQGEPSLGYGCINKACTAKVHRSLPHLDAYVEGAVVTLLADPRVRQALLPKVSGYLAEELQRMEERRVRKIAEFADDDSPLAADVLRVTVGKIDARIGEIRAELSRASASHVLDGLFGVSVEEFAGLPLSRRRAAARALLRVTVGKSRKGPGFETSSVRLSPAWLPEGGEPGGE